LIRPLHPDLPPVARCIAPDLCLRFQPAPPRSARFRCPLVMTRMGVTFGPVPPHSGKPARPRQGTRWCDLRMTFRLVPPNSDKPARPPHGTRWYYLRVTFRLVPPHSGKPARARRGARWRDLRVTFHVPLGRMAKR